LTLCTSLFEEIHKVSTTFYSLSNRKILYIFYKSLNIVLVIKSRRKRWVGYVACMGDSRGVYRVLVGKTEGKSPLGRPRLKWEDNIKMDLQEL
jgi:hypothetical protein